MASKILFPGLSSHPKNDLFVIGARLLAERKKHKKIKKSKSITVSTKPARNRPRHGFRMIRDDLLAPNFHQLNFPDPAKPLKSADPSLAGVSEFARYTGSLNSRFPILWFSEFSGFPRLRFSGFSKSQTFCWNERILQRGDDADPPPGAGARMVF